MRRGAVVQGLHSWRRYCGGEPDGVSLRENLHRSRRLSEKIWQVDMAQKRGEPVGTDIFNQLINSCIFERQLPQAILLFEEEMPRAGASPDESTFEALMYGHSRLGRPENVLRLYEDMKGASFPITTKTIHKAIRAAAEMRDGLLISSLLEEMGQSGIPYTEGLFNTLIDVCSKQREWSHVEQILMIMQKEGFPPSTSTYHAMLSGRAIDGEWSEALRTWQEMKADGIQDTLVTFDLLIKCVWSSGDVEGAMGLFQQLNESSLVPDVQIYTQMIVGLVNHGERELAEDLLNQMIQSSLIPTGKIWNTLLRSYCESNNQGGVQRCLQEMKETRIRVDRTLQRRFPALVAVPVT